MYYRTFPAVSFCLLDTFRPCGTTPYQQIDLLGKLINNVSPFYVLNGSHPKLPGMLFETASIECSYRSYQVSFEEDEPNCDLPPGLPSNCAYSAGCNQNKTISIKIRHCGSFYVYHLQPTHPLDTNFSPFNRIPKAGVYCGLKNAKSPSKSSIPCSCQSLKEDLSTLHCNSSKGENRPALQTEAACLHRILGITGGLSDESKNCSRTLQNEIRNQSTSFPIDNLKKEKQICYSVENNSRTMYIEFLRRITDIYRAFR